MVGAGGLRSEAHDFAGRLNRLLNRTVVATTVKIVAVIDPDKGGEEAVVGAGISARKVESQRFDLIGNRLQLDLSYRLRLNPGGHLTVESSLLYVYQRGDEEPLMYVDFERGKDRYAPAHFHIFAESEAWSSVLPTGRPLHKVHLPVGGRRYRPTIEDIMQMLIEEKMVEPRDDKWVDCIEEGRSDFYARQLNAAVWADPATAKRALLDFERENGAVDPA